MKLIYTIVASLLVLSACSTPGPITANPSKATSSPGTVGSAQMTNEMPRKPVVDPQRDTIPQTKP